MDLPVSPSINAEDSLLYEPNFVLNNGDVTIVEVSKEEAGKDGSDSGVELNGLERTDSSLVSSEATPSDTPVGPPSHALPIHDRPAPLLQDYDGTSEGGSESSSVLSHSRARKRHPTTPKSSKETGPGGRGALTTPQRARSIVSTPTTRDRSSVGRGSSLSRTRSISGATASSGDNAASRPASGRTQRPSSTSVMTSSTISNSSSRGRGSTPSSHQVQRSSSRGADDGRWPSTLQRPSTLMRGRTPSTTDRKHVTLKNSSSKNSVNSNNSNSASTPSPTSESHIEAFATLPRRRRRRSVESTERSSFIQTPRRSRVTLYHETGVQTCLTAQDVTNALEGKECRLRPIDAVEHISQEVQVDRDREDLVTMQLYRRLKAVCDMISHEVPLPPPSLKSPNSENTGWLKGLEQLEQRAALVRKRDLQQRNEIIALRKELSRMENFCRASRRQLHELKETEAESAELEEFIQQEKSMLAESLKEAEAEIENEKKKRLEVEQELQQQRQECQHLVRISEQRRQQILTLETRVARMEMQSRDTLQQGAAVSGAAVALSALTSRLEELTVRIEDTSDSSDAWFDVEEALRLDEKTLHVPTSTFPPVLSDTPESTLESVTEPVLDEGLGNRDSINFEVLEPARLVNSESLQNLSAAILYRRLEEETQTPNFVEGKGPEQLLDQIVDIDAQIGRVLRAIKNRLKPHHIVCKSDDSKKSDIKDTLPLCDDTINDVNKIDQEVEPSSILSHINGSGSDIDNSSANASVEISLKLEPTISAA